MDIKTPTKSNSHDIFLDVLRSAGVGLQIVATGDKTSGKKKLKTFFAVISGEVLASLFNRFQNSVEELNSSSEKISQKPLTTVPASDKP